MLDSTTPNTLADRLNSSGLSLVDLALERDRALIAVVARILARDPSVIDPEGLVGSALSFCVLIDEDGAFCAYSALLPEYDANGVLIAREIFHLDPASKCRALQRLPAGTSTADFLRSQIFVPYQIRIARERGVFNVQPLDRSGIQTLEIFENQISVDTAPARLPIRP